MTRAWWKWPGGITEAELELGFERRRASGGDRGQDAIAIGDVDLKDAGTGS